MIGLVVKESVNLIVSPSLSFEITVDKDDALFTLCVVIALFSSYTMLNGFRIEPTPDRRLSPHTACHQ